MNKKKLLALLMALVMTLSLVPVTAFAEEVVAKIGDTEYTTLQEAFNAVQDGQIIVLQKDLTQDDGVKFDRAGVSAKLNLNNKTFTVNSGSNVSNRAIKILSGTLEVYGGTIDAKGSATGNTGTDGTGCYGAFRAEVGTTLNLHDLTLYNYRPNGLNVKVMGATAELNNVNIISECGGGIEVTDNKGANGTVTGYAKLTNCAFTQSDYRDWCSVPVSASGNSTVDAYSTDYTGEYGAYVFSSGGTINIYSGTWTATSQAVLITSYDSKYGKDAVINVYGGSFYGPFLIHDNGHEFLNIYGGTFDHIPTAYVPTSGYEVTNYGNGTWTVQPEATPVAQIGDEKYETLESAVADANDGDTIELLQNASGAGLFVGPNKFTANGLTIDFGDHTYTVTSPVGSTGTVNQMLHFEQGNKITLTNGTINITDDSTERAAFEMIMQNYGSLTIDEMTIDGSGIAVATYSDSKYQAYPGWYNTDKPQFNYNTAGTSVIRNSTITVVGDLGIDDSANVTFEDDAIIHAHKIVTHGTDDRYTSTTSVTTVENGAKFSFDPTAVLASDQKAVLTDGLYVVTAKTPVARIGSTEYTSFVDAVAYANIHGNCTITILTDIDFSQDEYAGYKWVGSDYHPIEITGNDVVLDLNNHRFYNMGNFAIAIGHLLAKDGRTANVTVMNGRLEAGKTNNVKNSYVLGIAGADNANVINVVTDGGINICTGTTATTITNSTINGTKYYAVCAQTGSKVTIENSTITKNTDSSVATKAMFWVQGASTDSDCVTNINPTGAFDASAITIKSGSCTVNSTNGGEFYLAGGIKPVVEGGTFNFDPTDKGVADGYTAIANGNGTWTVGQSVTAANITGTTESTDDTAITPVVVTNSDDTKTLVVKPVADLAANENKEKTTKIKLNDLATAAYSAIENANSREVKIITGLSATQQVGGAAAPQTVVTDENDNVIFEAVAKGGQFRIDKKVDGNGYNGKYQSGTNSKADAIDYVDLRLQFVITLPEGVSPAYNTTVWSWTLKYGAVEKTVNGVNYLPVSGKANTYTSNVVVTNIPVESFNSMDFSATLNITFELNGVTYTISQSAETPLTRDISEMVNGYIAGTDSTAKDYATELKKIIDGNN